MPHMVDVSETYLGIRKELSEHWMLKLKESQLEAISIIQIMLCSGLEVREVKRIDTDLGA